MLRYNFILASALCIILAILTRPLWAQTEPSAQVRALSEKLMVEFQSGLNCNVNAIDLRDRLAKVEAELKSLRDHESKTEQVK